MPAETLTLDEWIKRMGGWGQMLAMYEKLDGDIRTLPGPVRDFILEELVKEDKAKRNAK